MSSVQQIAFDAVDRIGQLSCTDEILRELRRVGGDMGFEGFCITGVPMPNERIDPYVLLSGWPDGWLERYLDQNFVSADPVIRQVRQSSKPFAWSEAQYDRDDRSAARVMNEAPDFGLCDGLAVPIYTTDGLQALVTFGGEHPEASAHQRAAVHLIAIYAHARARELLSEKDDGAVPPKPRLSPREIECLKWTAAGKTAWETSTILNLSRRTVEQYLGTAALKLRSVNRVQAVAEALRHRLIQ